MRFTAFIATNCAHLRPPNVKEMVEVKAGFKVFNALLDLPSVGWAK